MKNSSLKRTSPLTGSIASFFTVGTLILGSMGLAKDPAPRPESIQQPRVEKADKQSTRTPDETLRIGLEYLQKQQQKDGGWGQGGGWRQSHDQRGGGRVEGAGVEDPPDLGNTCVSLVTLIRAENAATTPGERRDAIRKAFNFICQQVEAAGDDSLYVTAVRDTQLQVKIGAYVDTFLAGWALSELKGSLADDEPAEKRRVTALDKVVSKIERNQRADGSFDGNRGWAAVLSQGLASKALSSAARSGAKVSNEALDKDQRQNTAGLDLAKGDFSTPATTAAEPSSAGVSLYREAAKLGGLRGKSASNAPRKAEAEKKIASPDAPEEEKAKARRDLQQFADDDKAMSVAQTAVAGKLGDSRYVAGFGNNGGEEFLSYMNLGESLHERGGQEWTDWKTKMEATLCGAQNEDGSWAGHHCITGRTFCTSAALLTLLVERVKPHIASTEETPKPAPVAASGTEPAP